MPKRGLIAVVLTTLALVLLLNFKTPDVSALGGQGAQVVVGQPGATSGTGSGGGGAVATGQSGSYTGQITGSTVGTPFGNVQVKVTLQGGKITDVQTLQTPNSHFRSSQISKAAAPMLRSEVLAAQSAQVDTISGATYTSMGYLQSLQSALDQVGL